VIAAAGYAAIDCGTNSTRLLVSDSEGRPLERHMRITRLGEGVDASAALDLQAVDRTLDALRDYRGIIDRLGATQVRMTATSAARDASNSSGFMADAAAAAGVEVEILSGEDEARLAFMGATGELDSGDGPFLVVDIGGGSTEFAFGLKEPEGVMSVDMGCVRLTERFVRHDPPAPEELSQILSVARDYLDDVARALPATRQAPVLVGLAGTVSAVAAIEQGLATYDRDRIHHFVLTREAAEDVFRTLATETRAQRIENPGMEEARSDVIVAGTAILVAVMRFFGYPQCLVSESDILDGLILSLLRS